jgi:hypothetical protein
MFLKTHGLLKCRSNGTSYTVDLVHKNRYTGTVVLWNSIQLIPYILQKKNE